MKLKIIFGAVGFLASMCVGLQLEAAISIVYPQEDVWISSDSLQVVGMIDEEKDTFVIVKVGKEKSVETHRSPIIHGAFRSMVRLKQGENQIIVTSGSSKAKRTVYLAVSEQDVPKGLKRYHVHPSVETLSCNECHKPTQKPHSYKRVFPTKANCSMQECHPKIGDGEFVHGPLGAKVCIFCHNPHGSVLPNEVSRAGGDLCISCHQEEKKLHQAKATMLPVKEDNCAACHDPHQSSEKFLLKASSMEKLCYW